jgi:CBS domain-containing protein
MPDQSVESQLLAEPIGQLELSDYLIVTADTTVRETIGRLRELRRNCALIVGQGTHLVGIFTDYDVLRRVGSHPGTWDQSIETVMTPNPDTLPTDASTSQALRQMKSEQIDNLPIIGPHGSIRGTVTYYSILNFLTDHFPKAVYNLPPDPDNFASERDGG